MKKIALGCFLFCTFFTYGQTIIKGIVKDALTNELLIGANVMVQKGKGAVADINGNFEFKIDSNGTYSVTASFIGYLPQVQKITASGKLIYLSFNLETEQLDEVEIISDVAKMRETPVAFYNISTQKIEQEIGSRDMPMIMNSTPGVYATEQGGGSGDARISIRGFDQRNVAVMVDGVPVNDMENGWVYWSNWDGLIDITRTIQVQRGLGASKLAITSVGGTINILTRGIESKRSLFVKQEYGNNLFLKTSLGFNSGQLKNGWGIVFAGSRKTGDGFVSQTYTDAWSYFLKVQKRFDKHLISFNFSGAPQSHGQRIDRMPTAIYNQQFAKNLGVSQNAIDSVYQYSGYTTLHQGERGYTYNPHWGSFTNSSDQTITLNERKNYFHKPQFNLSHFWSANDKFTLSTTAYLSIGKGGGTRLNTAINRDTTNGQWNYQTTYDANNTAIDALYSTTENKSSRIIQSSINNHYWYGLLSSGIWNIDSNFTFTGGIDVRYYNGIHTTEVHDLLGGDYYIDNTSGRDQNQITGTYLGDPNFAFAMKRVGDKIARDYESFVYWGGLFSQLEYNIKKRWTIFATATISQTGYQRIDYFKNKDLVFADSTIEQAVGFGDTVTINGTDYTNTSPEARYSTTKRTWWPGYTAKAGANYNINEHQNIYLNTGIMQMAPRFDNVYTTLNKQNLTIEPQKVFSLELGYGIKYKKFAANINSYYTVWKNKPLSSFPTIRIAGDDYFYRVNGLNALHTGIEIDAAYKPLRNLEVEGLITLADWTTQSADKIYLFDADENPYDTLEFSAKGVHVGDAAQLQFASTIKYDITKGLYVKLKWTYFAKNFANFDLVSLTPVTDFSGNIVADNRNRESWQMPNYHLLDAFCGYEFFIKKLRLNFNAGLINILNQYYITDATNGRDFDAATSLVYFSQGRRFTTSLKITY